jgi:hypothetical protein
MVPQGTRCLRARLPLKAGCDGESAAEQATGNFVFMTGSLANLELWSLVRSGSPKVHSGEFRHPFLSARRTDALPPQRQQPNAKFADSRSDRFTGDIFGPKDLETPQIRDLSPRPNLANFGHSLNRHD